MKNTLYILSFIVWAVLFIPASAQAAARFYLSPSSGAVKVGDIISADVMVDTGGTSINAAEASLTFTSENMEYQSVVTTGSIFTFWTSGPTGSATSVSFGGGLSNPGYNGAAGKILTVKWKATANGTGTVTINGSKILANDGTGSNIYSLSSGGTFTIGQAAKSTPKTKTNVITVKSASHPDQSKWYSVSKVELSWSGSSDVTGFAWSFDQAPSGEPSTAAFTKTTNSTQNNVADGVWYLHVKGKTASGVTETLHFKVQIDTLAPDDFTVTVDRETQTSAPKVTFASTDSTSGIAKYEAKIDGGEWFAIASGDALPKQRPGSHRLTIRALDKAGNQKESGAEYTIIGIDSPKMISWTKVIGILNPVRFIGRSRSDDTIVVYLDGKEVDRFLAKEKQVPNDKSVGRFKAIASLSDEITWEYSYNNALFPGKHEFRFSLINKEGAESELSDPIIVTVEASTIKLGNWIVKTSYVVSLLILIIILLVLICLLQAARIHVLASHCGQAVAGATGQIKKLFSKTEKDIDKTIDTTIPDYELSKSSVATVKKELKKKIHETLEHEKDDLSR